MKSQLTQEILFDTLPVLLYAARNGLNPDLRPTLQDTCGVLLTQPNLLRCVSGCAIEILDALAKFGDETPSCQDFADALSPYILSLIVAGVVGDKEVSSLTAETTHAIMNERNTHDVFNRFTSLFWMRAYPGAPGPDGRVVHYSDLEAEARAILDAEASVAKLKANLFGGKPNA